MFNSVFVLLQFAKFRQLLKEAILLNDCLRKYTEKCLHLYDESSADESENLTLLDSAELHRSHDADMDSESVNSVVNKSSENFADKPSEKRTVRIVPTSQNHQWHSLSSSTVSQSDAESSPVIDKQESVKIWVRFGLYPFHFISHSCLYGELVHLIGIWYVATFIVYVTAICHCQWGPWKF